MRIIYTYLGVSKKLALLCLSKAFFKDGILWLARQINRLLGNTWTICKTHKDLHRFGKNAVGQPRFLPPWAIHLLSIASWILAVDLDFCDVFQDPQIQNEFIFNHLLLLSEDSDMAFLHYQERKLRTTTNSAETWSNAYYMPGTSNQPVTNLQPVVSTEKNKANQIGVLELGDNGWRRLGP